MSLKTIADINELKAAVVELRGELVRLQQRPNLMSLELVRKFDEFAARLATLELAVKPVPRVPRKPKD